MKENRFLYAVRFIAALFVITIHTRFPGRFGEAMDALARFAVPYFFAVTGRFLLANTDTDTKEIRKKTCKTLKKAVLITAKVYVIYLIFSAIYHLSIDVSLSEWFASKFNKAEMLNFIIFNSGKLIYDGSYTFDHMWYLFALIYVLVLIIIFAPVLRKWYKWLSALLLFLLYFGELLQTYYPIRPFGINICTWFVLRNWLLVGLPFVLVGIVFADYITDKRISSSEADFKEWQRRLMPRAAWGLVIGCILSVAERMYFDKKEVHLGSLIMVVSILFLSECGISFGKHIWRIGKEASGFIYFYHVLFIAIIDFLALKGILPYPPMWLKPLLVMFVFVAGYYLIKLIKEKRNGLNES